MEPPVLTVYVDYLMSTIATVVGPDGSSMEPPMLTVYVDYLMSTIATGVGPDEVPWNLPC